MKLVNSTFFVIISFLYVPKIFAQAPAPLDVKDVNNSLTNVSDSVCNSLSSDTNDGCTDDKSWINNSYYALVKSFISESESTSSNVTNITFHFSNSNCTALPVNQFSQNNPFNNIPFCESKQVGSIIYKVCPLNLTSKVPLSMFELTSGNPNYSGYSLLDFSAKFIYNDGTSKCVSDRIYERIPLQSITEYHLIFGSKCSTYNPNGIKIEHLPSGVKGNGISKFFPLVSSNDGTYIDGAVVSSFKGIKGQSFRVYYNNGTKNLTYDFQIPNSNTGASSSNFGLCP